MTMNYCNLHDKDKSYQPVEWKKPGTKEKRTYDPIKSKYAQQIYSVRTHDSDYPR